MKYSIEGFSQKKLLEFNLDIIDAFLLRWFSDFAATGGMKRLLRNGKIYFWIYYPTVVKEFPTMGIKNPKSIACRFNKYVINGLLDREIIKSQKGTYTYYAIISTVFRSLLYNPNNSNSDISAQNSNSGSDDFSQGIFNYSADSDVDSSVENVSNIAENDVETSVKSDISAQNSSSNSDDFSQSILNCCAQNILKCSALSDPSTSIYPSTTAANINKTNNINSSEQITFLKNQIQQYFDIACFSSDFFDNLSYFLINHKIHNDIVPEYLKFVYTKVTEKKPKSFLNYFYKVINQPYFSVQFFQNLRDKEQKLKPLKMHICQACKNEYNDGYEECVFCGLPKTKEGEYEQVIFHREIYNLNDEDRKKLKKEISEVYLTGFKKLKKPEKNEIQAIYEKYGIKQP